MDVLYEYRGLLWEGTIVTIELAIASVLLAVLLGLIGAMGKLSDNPFPRTVAGAYTTLIRGVPDLVLMLLLFYGGQQLVNDLGEVTGLWGYVEINQFMAGTLTIGFIFGAYMTETFRGAILAIPPGQIEAGIACGMSKFMLFRRITWPQMVRYALPSFRNNWLVLIKSTALVSVIGLQDVVYMAFTAGRSVRQLFTFMFAVLIIYLLLTALSEIGLRRLEIKYSAGVRKTEGA